MFQVIVIDNLKTEVIVILIVIDSQVIVIVMCNLNVEVLIIVIVLDLK